MPENLINRLAPEKHIRSLTIGIGGPGFHKGCCSYLRCRLLDDRAKMTHYKNMNGNELIKKLKKAGYNPRLDLKRGKGSHATLYANSGQTILKDRKKETGPGLLKSMLADLGLTPDDIK